MPKCFLNNNLIKKVAILGLAGIMFLTPVIGVRADKSSDEITDEKEEKEKERDKNQQQLNDSNENIKSLSVEQSSIDEQLEEETDNLVQVLAEMEVVEDQITEVEGEIVTVTDQLNATIELEKQQYDAMKVRIRYIYECGDEQLISVYLNSGSISEALTKADYIEDLYEYDRKMLSEYQQTIMAVRELKENLENKKTELVALNEDYKNQKTEMETIIDELKEKSDEYAEKIASAKSQAASYAQLIKEQDREIKRLEREAKLAKDEEQRKAAEAAAQAAKEREEQLQAQQEAANAAANEVAQSQAEQEDKERQEQQEAASEEVGGAQETGTVETGNGKYDVSPIYAAEGSALGKSIAVYGCQFIGNPYVRGGTSLTNGADCSGFTQSIYKNFGYSLPRTSYDQRFVGTEVSYSQAQPGDIICYAGHVAIYIGNGMIVHASTPSGGIKVGSATYTNILSVRRIVQ